MKIHWIVSNYPHQHNPQAGIFYKIFAEAIASEGTEITVIAPVPYTGPLLAMTSPKWKSYNRAPEYEVVNAVKIIRPRYFTFPGEADNRYAYKLMKRSIARAITEPPQLIHGFGSYPVSLAAAEVAKDRGFVSAHTFIGSDINDFPFRSDVHMKLFMKMVSLPKNLFAVSHDLAQKVTGLSNRSCDYIPMPVSEIHLQRPVIVEGRVARWKDKFIVLFAGNMTKEKGVEDICTAANLLQDEQDIHFLFAGPDSTLTGMIESLVNADYIGSYQHEEVHQLMRESKVLVLPSYNEGIPGVIKEAGQVELPVIATNVGGIPETLGVDRGYLIQPGNVHQLTETIKAVKNNYSEAKHRASLLRQFVNKQFSANEVATRQIEFYKKMVTEK